MRNKQAEIEKKENGYVVTIKYSRHGSEDEYVYTDIDDALDKIRLIMEGKERQGFENAMENALEKLAEEVYK